MRLLLLLAAASLACSGATPPVPDGGADGGPDAAPETGASIETNDGGDTVSPDGSGDGTAPDSRSPPMPLPTLALGHTHTCAVLDDGRVRCWGDNTDGQLGLGSAGDHRGDQPGEMGDALPPVDLGAGRTARALAAGSSLSCALLDDGRVKCWGNNMFGQLGLGDTNNRGDQPGEMGDALPAVDLGAGCGAAIAAGGSHACALLDDGRVKCWGNNMFGQLGLGDTNNRGDQPGEMGDSLPTVDLGAGRRATAIAAMASHTCAVLDDGRAKCWGGNEFGQLGLGDTSARGDQPGEMGDALPALDLGPIGSVRILSSGSIHMCALGDSSLVKCWGGGFSGRLGSGDTQVRGDQPGEMGTFLPGVFLGAGRVPVAVVAADIHTCALLETGQVKCWGHGPSLGIGSSDDRGDQPGEMGDALPNVDLGAGRSAIAIAAGSSTHTCAVLDDGALKCWGDNVYGQLGLADRDPRGDDPGEMGDALPAVDLGTGRSVRRAPGPGGPDGGTCGADVDGGVDGGADGDGVSDAGGDAATDSAGDAPPPEPRPALPVLALGLDHTCAILDGGQVKCWGNNDLGQLGLGSVGDHRGDQPGEMGDALPAVDLGAGRAAVTIAAGYRFTCAVLDDGHVKCWGSNGKGQLGLGDTSSRGDAPDEMGDALPAVDLGPGRKATAIATGAEHACALLDDGGVKCWGWNAMGQLGLGDTSSRGDAPDEMGDALPAVDLGPGRAARSITAGVAHSCASFADGSVKCWGTNNLGQLGLGDTMNRGDAPGEMGDNLPPVDLGSEGPVSMLSGSGFSDHTCALLGSCALKCWGNNSVGQLGVGDSRNRGDDPGEMGALLPPVSLGTGRTPFAVTAATVHTCALLDGGQVKCWGLVGRPRGVAPGELGDNLPAVYLGAGRKALAIAAGYFHTCAVLDTGAPACWGDNRSGELGLGDMATRSEPTDTGGALPAVDLGTGRSVQRSAGSAAPGSTFTGALGCLDQSFTTPINLGSDLYNGFTGQTYTAGATGTLTGVAIDVRGNDVYPMRVTVRGVEHGVPNATVLGQRMLPTAGSPPENIITFETPIPQIAGQQYAIIVSYPGAPPPPSSPALSQGIWNGAFGNVYTGGQEVGSSNGDGWFAYPDFDLHFQTYVDPR